MRQTLKRVFDYQSFSPNSRLSAMIKEVENRYCALDDEDLFFVAAAGDTNITNHLLEKKDGDMDRTM